MTPKRVVVLSNFIHDNSIIVNATYRARAGSWKTVGKPLMQFEFQNNNGRNGISDIDMALGGVGVVLLHHSAPQAARSRFSNKKPFRCGRPHAAALLKCNRSPPVHARCGLLWVRAGCFGLQRSADVCVCGGVCPLQQLRGGSAQSHTHGAHPSTSQQCKIPTRVGLVFRTKAGFVCPGHIVGWFRKPGWFSNINTALFCVPVLWTQGRGTWKTALA